MKSGQSILRLCVPVLLLAASCTNHEAARKMDAVESYINARPDSALSVLQGMEAADLRTRAQKARYALLHTMALDKSYGTVTLEQLRPAIAWYSRRGTPDERMKTLYYQGRILARENSLGAAMIRYRRAEALAGQAQDTHAVGLLYEAEAAVYRQVYNLTKELEYSEKAVELFERSGDPLRGSAQGELALVYHSMENWETADSLYREAVRHSDPYPHALSVYLSNYARLKVLRPDKDPAGTVELLERKRSLTGGGLSPKEAGAYAYAAELLGDRGTVEDLLPRLEAMTGRARFDVLPWLARIALAREDYETAYAYREESHDLERETIREVLSDSVTHALLEDTARQQEAAGLRFRIALLSVGVALLVLLSVILWIGLAKRRVETERDRLLDVHDLLQADLRQSERKVQESNMRERVNRLRHLGGLRSAFWRSERGSLSEATAVATIKKEVDYIFRTDDDGKRLTRQLDRELGGSVSRLQTELHLQGQDVLFLCCCILDLEPEMIAETLGISKSNVYTKRSRLRSQIRELGDPLLSILVEKS